MAIQTIKVPDIGGAEGVDVIEISVKVGDVIAEGDSIVVLETDKASMEIPADRAGKVVAIKVKEGDKVSQDGTDAYIVAIKVARVTDIQLNSYVAMVPMVFLED